MLMNVFHVRCDFNLYILKYDLRDKMDKLIRNFGMTSALECSPNEQVSMLLKQA